MDETDEQKAARLAALRVELLFVQQRYGVSDPRVTEIEDQLARAGVAPARSGKKATRLKGEGRKA